MKTRAKRIFLYSLWSVLGIAAALVIAFLAIVVKPGGDGVLGEVTTPDGARYVVEQRCNWGAEPYTVSFYLKPPGGQWGWCYIDHEADRWSDVAMIHDPARDEIIITRKGVRSAWLDLKTGIFHSGAGSTHAPQGGQWPAFAKL